MGTIEELYKQSRTAQDKFTYFLLAAAGSAIAFSVQEVSDRTFSYTLIPLAITIFLWGISFYCGCLNIKYICSTIYANYGLVQTENGENEEVPNNPEYIKAAAEGIKSAMKSNAEKAGKYSDRQFKILILGAICYIAWQLVEMWVRSI